MSASDDLIQYLGHDFSEDYWSDEAILHAFEITHGFQERDWSVLLEVWQQQPESWQRRCAEVLSDANRPGAVRVLMQMTGEGTDEVAITAADSLRAVRAEDLALELAQSTIDRLRELAQRGNAVTGPVLKDLLRRVEEAR